MEDYKKIGTGSCGTVYRTRHKGRDYAVKIFLLLHVDPKNPCSESIISELNQLRSLRHECIVKYFNTDIHEHRQLALFMELCDENLTDFLQRNLGSLPYYIQLDINLCIARAVEYLHKNSIIHGNLTSNNVLMVANNRVKVSDYGMARFKSDDSKLFDEFSVSMPLQACSKPPTFSIKLDVLSCGVLIDQILTCAKPVDQQVAIQEEGTFYMKEVTERGHPLKEISLQCLQAEEESRPTSSDLVQKLNKLEQGEDYSRSYENHHDTYQHSEPSSDDYTLTVNITLVGEPDVGKTNLIKVYVGEWFGPYKPTLRPDCSTKIIDYNGKRIKVIMWDTVGQERFMSMTRSVFRKAKGVLVVYDVTCRETFTKVSTWIREANDNCCSDKAQIILVGNKIDNEDGRDVLESEGRRLAETYGILFFETSAKKKANVNKVFYALIDSIMTNDPPQQKTSTPTTSLISAPHHGRHKCC